MYFDIILWMDSFFLGKIYVVKFCAVMGALLAYQCFMFVISSLWKKMRC